MTWTYMKMRSPLKWLPEVEQPSWTRVVLQFLFECRSIPEYVKYVPLASRRVRILVRKFASNKVKKGDKTGASWTEWQELLGYLGRSSAMARSLLYAAEGYVVVHPHRIAVILNVREPWHGSWRQASAFRKVFS